MNFGHCCYTPTRKNILTRMGKGEKRVYLNMGFFLPLPFVSGNFYPLVYINTNISILYA